MYSVFSIFFFYFREKLV